ncbi:MAG TPA: sigma-54 dependent transcriptional regulator [Xanthomonadales bacterium]|nr:sigma-54 dependent transcriptional regulator [Xanthomonadales bacterium]
MDQAKVTPELGAKVLVVDDESSIARTFRYCLEDAGFRVAIAQNGSQAEARLEQDVYDVCFLDLRLGDESGLELLPKLKSIAPWMRVVVVTANAGVDTAVAAMQAGAADYLVKPCSAEQLRHAAEKQVEARRLETRLEELERANADSETELKSESPAFMKVLETARQVADTDASVLILGESGTGKGVLAKAIHGWSRRRQANFVTVSCPALSPELVESELFGHRKGSFTGASENAPGRVSHADGGTLFLDEIGDFPLVLQPKLLRFIQDKEYERVGDPVTRRADVRIIAATNHNLTEMVKTGGFREDLLFRLNVITLLLPPLRERPDDVTRLAERFLERFVAAYRRPARGFTQAAMGAIRRYRWPGNIRELRNVIERAAIVCAEPEVDVRHLALDAAQPETATVRVGAPVSLEQLERAHIAALMATSGTLEEAARKLGIDVSTLYRKRKQYEL